MLKLLQVQTLAPSCRRFYGRTTPHGPYDMHQTNSLIASLFITATLAGCAQFPELEDTIAPSDVNGARQTLIPLAPLVARANSATVSAESAATGQSPRVGTLRNRASALRGPVIDPVTRARMLRGVR